MLIRAKGETLLYEIESRIKDGGRGFQVPSGLSYKYNTDLPDMSRVTQTRLADGSSLDPDKEYTVAIDDSTVRKPHFSGVEVLRSLGGCQKVMMDYFQKGGPWKNTPDDRVARRP